MTLSPPEVFQAWRDNGLVVSQMVDLNGTRFDTVDESYFDIFGRFYQSVALRPHSTKWNCLSITADALAYIRRGNARDGNQNPVLAGSFEYYPDPDSRVPVLTSLSYHALVCFLDAEAGKVVVKFWEPQQFQIVTLTDNEKSSQLNPVRFY
jgi:hypothetical protein